MKTTHISITYTQSHTHKREQSKQTPATDAPIYCATYRRKACIVLFLFRRHRSMTKLIVTPQHFLRRKLQASEPTHQARKGLSPVRLVGLLGLSIFRRFLATFARTQTRSLRSFLPCRTDDDVTARFNPCRSKRLVFCCSAWKGKTKTKHSDFDVSALKFLAFFEAHTQSLQEAKCCPKISV